MIRYKQTHISKSVVFFSNDFKEKYNLIDYFNPNEPSIFFGMYRDDDVTKLLSHNSNAVIIWCGSDAMKVDRIIDQINLSKNVKHISISSFVKNSLLKNGIESTLIPIRPKKSLKKLTPRGDKIYFYHGTNSKNHWDFYGGEIVDQLKKLLPFEIVCTTKDAYNDSQLEKIYKDCFIGLRLTKHDGCSNTVCELGLMGRKCIHNGDIPNCINYSNIDDIISSIYKEYYNRNEDNEKIATDVFNYLNISDDWLYV
jgi:hypothetical protein